MATRYVRNTVILAEIESVYGTDPTPTEAANAMLVSNASITKNFNTVNRDLLRGYLGGSEQLAGTESVEISFDVELAGSGTAGTAPAWGALMRACGWEETASPGVRVEYNPATPADESVTIHYFMDGIRHIATGCRGTFTLSAAVGEIPKVSFSFTGKSGSESAASASALTLTAWQKPLVVSDPNTGDVTLGCTYATTPALTSGTAYISRGLTLDAGNSVAYNALLGGETVDIGQRETTGSITLDLTAAQEVTLMTAVRANTTQGLGLVHGTTGGNKVLVFAPAVQLVAPKYEDANGKALVAFDVRFVPSAGNDELKIVTF